MGKIQRWQERLVERVRIATDLPLITKLTPNVTDIVAVARATMEAGTNALSLINTIKARAKILNGPEAGK